MKDIHFDEKNALTIWRVGFVSVARDAGYTFEYKLGKELHSFVFVESGALEYVFPSEGKRLCIQKGGALYIPKHLPYKTIYLEKNTTIKILIFDTDEASLPAVFHAPIFRKDREILEIFRALSDESIHNALFLCAKIYELLSVFKSEKTEIAKKYAKILPALREIKQSYQENHPLSHYASLCRMSESNFRLLFKQYTGKSPIEYRNRIRIAEARRMIDSGEFTVSEAAYLTGFNNMSFFYELLHAY